MACSSAITELIAGKTAFEVRKLKKEQLIQAVGGLPEASSHAAQLALDAVATLLKKAVNLS